MSVTIRPYRGGGWEVDIRVVSPDGTRHKRERKHAPISSRTAVGRWAEARERVLFERLLSPPNDHPRKEVPTLQEFAPRFIDGHARAAEEKCGFPRDQVPPRPPDYPKRFATTSSGRKT